jgi:WXG100 family type VII secretion target
MAKVWIKVHFDDVSQVGTIFSQQGNAARQTLGRIKSQVDNLRGGAWVGRGANAFYSEMDSLVFPALKALADAMDGGKTILGKASKVMHQAEDDSAKVFQVDVAGILGGLAGAVAGAAGAAAAGLAGAAGAAAGMAGGAAGEAASASGGGGAAGQGAGFTLAVDPSQLFSQVNLQALIGSQFQGTGPELGQVMGSLAQNPSGDDANSLLIELSGLRGRGTIEITIEFGKFQDLQAQQAVADAASSDAGGAAAQAAEAAGGGGGGSQGFQGSLTQMRYGKIVGDALGIDPAFGAMLNPSGGLLGPGHFAIAGGSSAVGYHAIAHAAGGYLLTNHNVGPGFDYMAAGQSASASHRAGIAFWKSATGGSSGLGGTGDWVMSSFSGSVDTAGSALRGVRSLF